LFDPKKQEMIKLVEVHFHNTILWHELFCSLTFLLYTWLAEGKICVPSRDKATYTRLDPNDTCKKVESLQISLEEKILQS
jgi:hypothetical protein